MVVADYYNRVNHELLAVIPPDAKAVLEIGCGAGALCEAYRRINPGVEWIGVDISHDAVIAAKDRGVDAYCYDAESSPPSIADDWRKYDCLILGDILEHMKEPWAFLKNAAVPLIPSAQVIASIPNVQHFCVLMHVMTGNWDYVDEGPLDRTHLRFFTQKTIREMFTAAGLHIHEIKGIRAGNHSALGWDDWLKIARAAKLDPENIKQSAALQYLVRAVKPWNHPYERITFDGEQEPVKSVIVNVVPKLHIHAIGDGTCCERPRLHEPMAMLRTIPGVRCTFRHSDPSFPTDGMPDIFIQQRFRCMYFESQQKLIDQGSIIIAEIDDDPAHLQGMSDDDYAPLRAVHAVQCSTEVVAETCRAYNPNVMVFENQIAELPPLGETDTEGWIHIFCGWQNREKDWESIMPALRRVVADHKVVVNVVNDKAFYEAIKDSCEANFFPWCDYPEYRLILRDCDIALLPLEDTRMNRHKSDLKFIECAAEGVAVLASPIVYKKTIIDPWKEDDPIIGYAYSNYGTSLFEGALKLLINGADNRRHVALSAYNYIRDHRLLGQHYRKRYEWYLSLISARQALHEQLLARCPELRTTASAQQPLEAQHRGP